MKPINELLGNLENKINMLKTKFKLQYKQSGKPKCNYLYKSHKL